MRILYLGLPMGALALTEAGHPPVVAGLVAPAPGLRRARLRLGATGALVLGQPSLDDPAVRALVAAAAPDVLLSYFWPRLVPAAIRASLPLGAFGTHPSKLPRWRGPDPYFWALRAGDAETGVTLHELDDRYDTGPVVAGRSLPIRDGDDAWSLARRLDRPALELLVEAATRLAGGERLRGVGQDDRDATDAPAPTDADLEIDWRAPVEEILRLVQAAAPWPGALAWLGDRPVHVLRARRSKTPPPAALEPAEAYLGDEGVVVRARDGGVVLTRLRDAETESPIDPAAALQP